MATVTEKLEGMDVWIYHGQIYIPNAYAAGGVGSQFLIALRDKKRLWARDAPPAIVSMHLPGRSAKIASVSWMNGWR